METREEVSDFIRNTLISLKQNIEKKVANQVMVDSHLISTTFGEDYGHLLSSKERGEFRQEYRDAMSKGGYDLIKQLNSK